MNDDKITSYNILKILEKEPETNQRDLAKISNLSLGKIHYILKAIKEKRNNKSKKF